MRALHQIGCIEWKPRFTYLNADNIIIESTINMSEGGGSLLNALKVKLLEEQKELQELRINYEKCQDELKVETEKKAEVIA